MSIKLDLGRKSTSAESIARKALNDRKVLSEVFKGISSDKPPIKYKSLKALAHLSEKHPRVLYPKWNYFVELLSNENTFLRAIAANVIANLTVVDSKKKFEKIFDLYYNLLDDRSMINAANLAGNSGKIAVAKPHLQDKITNRLMDIDKTHHSPECKNIIKGKVILSFDMYIGEYGNKKKILDFVKKELKNRRSATRKKADRFLKKWHK